MKINRTLLFSLLGLLGVSGCTHLDTEFQCSMLPTVHCKSLDQINRMVLAGQLGRENAIPIIDETRKPKRHFV